MRLQVAPKGQEMTVPPKPDSIAEVRGERPPAKLLVIG